MPRLNRPATTGYERLAQAEQYSDDSADEDPLTYSTASLQPVSGPRFAPIPQPRPHSGMTSPKAASSSRPTRALAGGPGSSSRRPHHSRTYSHQQQHQQQQPPHRRARSNSGVDLKAINARLERWADEIAARFKKRGRRGHHDDEDDDEGRLEIHHTVFQAPEGVRPVSAEALAVPEPGYMPKADFDALLQSVQTAIDHGVHPRMISKGSSGSYFARNPDGKVVGVFKPKDEEPYAAGNPKWNKWIHRNLFPCCFGRACLIPNLSYVSEAAAYVLDVQLRTCLVPYTDVVWLSSKSFHYPFWDRYNYSRKKKPLPAKPGSFQVFLKGFKDANLFLREHPWPDQYLSGYRTNDTHRRKKKRWAENCRPSSAAGEEENSEDDGAEAGQSSPASQPGPDNFAWTEGLKQSFREELEKLVILDYIMRNTDRGLDNWMIRVDWSTQEVAIVSDPVQLNMAVSAAAEERRRELDDREDDVGPRPVDLSQREPPRTRASYPSYRTQKPMDASTPSGGKPQDPSISVGAIDNSLSWPWKHPDAWRSFPFGWLFLPVDLIGRPFSQKTRDHFLPLLTSTHWWSQTQAALRRVFQIDPDFQERMFARQIAVMKGQAWNVVETLKQADHGPLELTRRAKVCVWDDLVDVPVAVPMRPPSAEMRRRADVIRGRGAGVPGLGGGGGGSGTTAAAAGPERLLVEEEEMDIGAAVAPTAAAANGGATGVPPSVVVDLLGGTVASPMGDLPHPGRFEMTDSPLADGQSPAVTDEALWSPLSNGNAQTSSDPSTQRHSPTHQSSQGGLLPSGGSLHQQTQQQQQQRPTFHASFSNGPTSAQRGLNMYSPERRYSAGGGGNQVELGGRRPSHAHSHSANYHGSGVGLGSHYLEDELEAGDLGYAVAEGMEGNQRKVIVERLEAVKSKNPVFTWC